jgi:hypothetical protein
MAQDWFSANREAQLMFVGWNVKYRRGGRAGTLEIYQSRLPLAPAALFLQGFLNGLSFDKPYEAARPVAAASPGIFRATGGGG